MEHFSKQFAILNKIATIATTITIIGGAYYYYKTEIWRPKLRIISVDWKNNTASIQQGNSKILTLYPNQIIWLGGDFGIKFSGNTENEINRIELVRNGLTYKIVAQKN